MRNYDIELLPRAQRDLTEIDDYIMNDLLAPQAAIDLFDKFIDAFERLQKFPLSGTELNAGLPLKNEYRWVLVEHYLIFYTVNDNLGKVTIARVLYASRNYLNILE